MSEEGKDTQVKDQESKETLEKSLNDYVVEAAKASEEKAKEAETEEKSKEPEEKKAEEDKKASEEKKAKDKETHNKTASERVQQAVNEKNEHIKKNNETVAGLKAEIAEIKQAITSQPKPEEKEAKKEPEYAFDEKALREQLEDLDYSDKQIEDAIKKEKEIVQLSGQVKKLTKWAEGVSEAKQEEQAEKAETTAKGVKAQMLDSFEKMSKEFPEIFTGKKEEDGSPKVKEEYDKKLMELLDEEAVYYEQPDGQEAPDYPSLRSERKMRMLFREVYQPVLEARKVKAEQKKEEDIEGSELEGAKYTGKQRTEPKTLLEVVSDAMK